MFINAIRYRTYNDDQLKAWRFGQGSGNLKKFVVFCESDHILTDIISALQFALRGKQTGRVVESALQIVDDAGDTYLLERTLERTRILRNGKTIEGEHMAQTFLNALLGFDVSEDCSQQLILSVFKVSNANDELIAEIEDKSLLPLRKLNQSVEKQKRAIVGQIAKSFEEPVFDNVDLVLNIRRRAEPIFTAFKEMIRQRRSLLANSQSLDQIDPKIIDHLAEEIEIIKQIEKCAAPLLDPANSPKVLKEKLVRLETELHTESRQYGIDEVPEDLTRLPWDKLVSCLSKLEAFERLVQASEKTQEVYHDRVEIIQSEYLRTLDQLISNDTQITAELESCLSALNLQTSNKKYEKTTLSDLFINFIKPSADVPPEETESEKLAKLETARMAVDFALARLGELHANLDSARESFENMSLNARDHHEHLVREYGKLKQLWHRLSKEHKIPSTISLIELLKLCLRYTHLAELEKNRKQLRTLVNERRGQLSQLEELVRSWRNLTESQKDSTLDNPAILVAEAQSIVRYLGAKEQQHEKLIELKEHFRSYQAISNNISQRESQIRQTWRKLFNDLELQEVSIEKPQWNEFFTLADQLLAWTLLLEEQKQNLKGKDIFSAVATDSPIAVFRMGAQELDASDQLRICEALEYSNFEKFCLLTTSNKNLAEILNKTGCGASRNLPQPNLKTAQPTSATAEVRLNSTSPTSRVSTPPLGNGVLSHPNKNRDKEEKLENLLRVLNQRRGTSSDVKR